MNKEQIIYNDHNGLTVGSLYEHEGEILHGHVYGIDLGPMFAPMPVVFQRGPVKENGVNGATNGALLAILLHRTKVLNDKFPCEENNRALYHMTKALEAFNERTAGRVLRGVEGTNQE